MDSRSNIITRKQISYSYLILRAPKYVHQLEAPKLSVRCLKAFKAVKKLTCISKRDCDRYYHGWGCGCESNKEACVREALFKHFKTYRTRYEDDFGFDLDRYERPYDYRYDQDRLTRRFYERQITWDKYSLSVFSGAAQYWKDFLTKCSIHNVFVDFDPFNEKRFSLDVSRLARHLTVLKGLEILSIRISSFDDGGQTLKFLKLLNKISPLLCSETKIRLVLPFDRESNSSCDISFQTLGSLPNILQRIAHLEISFDNASEAEFESLVNFTGLLSRLRSFDLNTQKMDYFGYNPIEHLFDKLSANVNIQMLKVSEMEWDSRTHPSTNTLELSRYKGLLSRLNVFSVRLPRLSFRHFDTKANLNLSIKAKEINLVGNIIDWNGFSCFLEMLKPETTHSSSLSLDIRNSGVKDINSAFEALAKKCEFETVNIFIQNWGSLNTLIYGNGLSELLIKLAGPRCLKFNVEVCCPSIPTLNMILEALENSSRTLEIFTINNFYQFYQEDDGYRMSILGFVDGEWLHEYESNFYSEEEHEEYGYGEEMLQINYLDKRHRPTERKNKRKIFVE